MFLFDVGPGALVATHAAQGDLVDGPIGLAVTAAVEAVTVGLAGAGGDRADATQRREAGLAGQALGIVASGDQQCGGSDDADAVRGQQRRRVVADRLAQARIDGIDLAVEVAAAGGELLEAAAGDRVHVGGIRPRTQAPQPLQASLGGQWLVLLAQRVGGADQDRANLLHRGGAGLER